MGRLRIRKTGGARVIYYWAVDADTVLMLYAFEKNERAELTPAQLEQLRTLVEVEFP